MNDWRFGGSWTQAELQSALQKVLWLRPNFEARRIDEMTPDCGWNHVRSEAVIACEPPGPPLALGPFHRAKQALAGFDFSDPRIVTPHFEPGSPLKGRRVLLELKGARFHYLCPAHVAEVHDSDGMFELCLETLEGHIEAGREWLRVTKDRVSGEIRFQIRAAWRAGDFPNAWSWFGFQLLGRRYQRAWHHLAHERLRQIAAGEGALPSSPVHFNALRARALLAPGMGGQQEALRTDRLLLGMGLAALCGVRTFIPHAVRALADAGNLRGLPGSRRVSWAATSMAVGELIIDKLPTMPDRISPPLLVGRVASGALAADLMTHRRGTHRVAAAALGAAAAVVTAFASFRVRRAVQRVAPGPLSGLVEDAGVIAAAAALIYRARSKRRARATFGADAAASPVNASTASA